MVRLRPEAPALWNQRLAGLQDRAGFHLAGQAVPAPLAGLPSRH
jgi:hypothetical protein